MITAVASKKGGVGKTTTTVSLAAGLAGRGQRVLLIDLDPNASASLSLGLTRQQFVPGAADLLLRDCEPEQSIRSTALDHLDVMPASIDLASVEGDLDRITRNELVLRNRLEAIQNAYDHILVDCPSSLGLLTRNALAAADAYIVPAVPHYLAVEGLEQLFAAVERLRFRCHSETRLLGILPTLADYRAKMTRMGVDALRQRFGTQVFAIEIRVNTSLAEAPAFGKTIYDYEPRSTGARSYGLVTEEFLLRCERLRPDPVAAPSTAPDTPPPEAPLGTDRLVDAEPAPPGVGLVEN